MKRPIDDLDQMIDDLNANREPDNIGENGELADLVELVRGLKELGHTVWPDESFPMRTAIQLSQQLNPTVAPQSIAPGAPDLYATGEIPPHSLASRDTATPTRLHRKRQSGLRIVLEIAAAAAILIAFTALIATLFGNITGGSQPSAPAAQPNIGISAPPPFATASASEFNATIKSINDTGNGRNLHLTQTDGGYSVTLNWVGVTQDRVLISLTAAGPAADAGASVVPAVIEIRDPSGVDLSSAQDTPICAQSLCLLMFDRSSIADLSGNVPLHAEIFGLYDSNVSPCLRGGCVATPMANYLSTGSANIDSHFTFDFNVPSWKSLGSTASSVTAATPTVSAVSNPMLEELQAEAGFDLLAPANVPSDLMLAMTAIPTPLPSFKSVVFKYQNAPVKPALTITEASPYRDSAETMPADIFNSAMPQDLGNGTTVSVYQSSTDIQIWWEVGPTSLRLESDGAPGTTLLTKDQMLNIARSMVPVSKLPVRVSVPADGKVQTADEAIVQARTLLGSVGGNAAAPASTVGLQALSEETALGLPQPSGMDANAPVWSVTFPNGVPPQGCPQLGVSVCNTSSVTVIVDARSGNILAWRDPSGAWKQP